MPGPPNPAKTLLIIHRVYLVVVVVLTFLGEYLHSAGPAMNPIFSAAVAVCAVIDAGLAFFIRQKFSAAALEVLRADPANVAALGRWRLGQFAPMVMAVSVALFGFVLRFLGAPLPQAALFYVGSIVLLLYFRPSDPVA